MKGAAEYRLAIDAYTPETMPMSRLAEYMGDLARLLGEHKRVHFSRLEDGSTVLVQTVEPEAVPRVRNRIQALTSKSQDASEDAVKAFAKLNRKFADDNATGSLREKGGTDVVQFPGREDSRTMAFGAFNQQGVLDGVLIRIGGRDDAVPVHLQDGETIHVCSATRHLAKKLALHLFGPTLRVTGQGRWKRGKSGRWAMERFRINSFEQLDDAPLGEVVQELRRVEGSRWKNIDNPSAELRRLRGLDKAG
ncbi:hypothetical protein [Candidatus Foliamicus sp.]